MLQQYGTPDDLYNRPANRFVASFVGSVLINFLPARYERANGAATVTVGGEGAQRDRRSAARRGRVRTGRLEPAPAVGRIPARDAPARGARLARSDAARARSRSSSRSARKDVDPHDARATRTSASSHAPGIGARASATTSASRSTPTAVHLFDDETGLALR